MKFKFNFFKPKAAKQDFSQSMLPHTRKEVFFDVLKLHWKELLALGLALLVFSLPFLFSQLWQDSVTLSLTQSLTDQSTDEEVLAVYEQVAATENMRAFFAVALLLVYAVGFSGVVRVVRQYAWEENVRLGAEFGKGIKQNVGQNLLTALLGGIVYALCVGIVNMATMSEGVTAYLLFLPVDISLIIVFPIFAYTISATCVYANKWRQNVKIGFVVFSKNPFKTLLALICCCAIYIPQFIPNVYCHIIGRIVSPLLTPFALLGWLLFSFGRFDKIVNERFYPYIVGKGLFVGDKPQQAGEPENDAALPKGDNPDDETAAQSSDEAQQGGDIDENVAADSVENENSTDDDSNADSTGNNSENDAR